jgi:hypothetical protein
MDTVGETRRSRSRSRERDSAQLSPRSNTRGSNSPQKTVDSAKQVVEGKSDSSAPVWIDFECHRRRLERRIVDRAETVAGTTRVIVDRGDGDPHLSTISFFCGNGRYGMAFPSDADHMSANEYENKGGCTVCDNRADAILRSVHLTVDAVHSGKIAVA